MVTYPKYSTHEWSKLITTYPEFGDMFDRWDELEDSELVDILCEHPQFYNKRNKWCGFDGAEWVRLLRYQPQFAGMLDGWFGVSYTYFNYLLKFQPQFHILPFVTMYSYSPPTVSPVYNDLLT